MAGFPATKTLDVYDFRFAVGTPQLEIKGRADLASVVRKENIFLPGPSGTSKTHLAVAQAYLATQHNMKVRFIGCVASFI